jgi:hypothetical protein
MFEIAFELTLTTLIKSCLREPKITTSAEKS